MSDECDPIIEAGDDGEVLDETDDGAIACVADGDGMTVRVDPDSELGEWLSWHAGHRGESANELLADAIQEFIEDERRERSETATCEHCGECFDVDEARWQCPDCGEWTRGPPPGN